MFADEPAAELTKGCWFVPGWEWLGSENVAEDLGDEGLDGVRDSFDGGDVKLGALGALRDGPRRGPLRC